MYKKIRLFGFMPWFVKLSTKEAKTILAYTEVLDAFSKSCNVKCEPRGIKTGEFKFKGANDGKR